MDKPQNGEQVLLKISSSHDGQDTVVIATYWHTPFSSEAGHFHGNFGVNDDCCRCDGSVELLEWVGFSGRGKLNG